jgi:AbiJ N-terminal domain 4
MSFEQSFSKRNRYSGAPKEITIREDAPKNMRYVVLQTAVEIGWGPSSLRRVLCGVLRVPPDEKANWSEYSNIWREVQDLMYGCEWFQVYDFIEALYDWIGKHDEEQADQFAESLNAYFIEEGIGWQLLGGNVVTRGTEAFEAVISGATVALTSSQRPTAATHLHERLEDLSRRPQADLSGAVYHALGALECVVRDVTGDPKAKLDAVVKRFPGLLPKPLDEVVPKIWGYASNEARLVVEGKQVSRKEAELLVGLSTVLTGYLTSKQP